MINTKKNPHNRNRIRAYEIIIALVYSDKNISHKDPKCNNFLNDSEKIILELKKYKFLRKYSVIIKNDKKIKHCNIKFEMTEFTCHNGINNSTGFLISKLRNLYPSAGIRVTKKK